jgi:multiple antibiotic resistance protein
VLIRVAFELLQGGRSLRVTPEESQEGVEKDDISVTPLAVPILCGPATIATAILLSTETTTWPHRALLATVIITMYGATFGLLAAASKHSRYLGATTIKVSSRLMGLVLVAVAVEFVIQGLNQSLFKTV